MWRSVQIRRFVERTIKDRARGESTEDAEILRQGVCLVLHILYIKIPLQNDAGLALTEAENMRLSAAIDIIANQLLISTKAQNFTKQFRSVFENNTDCQTIKRSMMAALTQHL